MKKSPKIKISFFPVLKVPSGTRRNNQWEPFFDKEIQVPKSFFKFSDSYKNKLSIYCYFHLDISENLSNCFFDRKTFWYCDFTKVNSSENRFIFKNCTFIGCDFGLSTWIKVKFTACTFDKCSFTQSTIIDSEFRDCDFKLIFYSGNETDFQNTIVTNPRSFINSIEINKEVLKGKNPEDIWKNTNKLLKTKATFAHLLVNSLKLRAADDEYYEALKCRFETSIEYRIDIQKNNKKCFRLNMTFWKLRLEKFLINAFGWMNNWGQDVSRIFISGFIILMIFSILWFFIMLDFTIMGVYKSILEAFEIFFLFGYTKYSNEKLPTFESVICIINAFVGMLWYIIAVPTLINRITKARD